MKHNNYSKYHMVSLPYYTITIFCGFSYINKNDINKHYINTTSIYIYNLKALTGYDLCHFYRSENITPFVVGQGAFLLAPKAKHVFEDFDLRSFGKRSNC